jgi:hypothetical protein
VQDDIKRVAGAMCKDFHTFGAKACDRVTILISVVCDLTIEPCRAIICNESRSSEIILSLFLGLRSFPRDAAICIAPSLDINLAFVSKIYTIYT